MAAPKLKDKIEVPTDHGICEIQLTFGSVTKLQEEDKVDVLAISAYSGSYQPTPRTVLHALKNDLGISVKELAQDKEEDLRRLFSCWWSKPLSGCCIFDRILCFEGGFKKGSRPPKVIGEVFRSLVSLSKDQDVKVMMPLLASGGQGYSESLMLRLIVDAAVHWMQIGLPLKTLKIVVYAEPLDRIDENPLLQDFNALKQKWMETFAKKFHTHAIDYDVYLSYSLEDKNLADQIKVNLSEKNKEIRIYSGQQQMNEDESWQEEIYQVMVSCARVITVLSPRFLADEACLEQYNIALCCTRNMKRDYLAPFYVDSIDEMPTYMCLIQYVDCRPNDLAKISAACDLMNDWLQLHIAEVQTVCLTTKSEVRPRKKVEYDVFISYSHSNASTANSVYKHLSIAHPDWNIFIDISELKTGVAWQIKLYESIESCSIFIALLSPAYVASKVCQEEYNLAFAMHSDASYDTMLFPILIEAIDKMPSWCNSITPLDCKDVSDESLGTQFLPRFAKDLAVLEKGDSSYITETTSKWRSQNFLSDFAFLPSIHIKDTPHPAPKDKDAKSSSNTDVVLCYHERTALYAKFLQERLKFYQPNIAISLPEQSAVRHQLLDEATLVVPILSSELTVSPELSEEINTALCRQRFSDELILFPIGLDELSLAPVYFRLLSCLFSCIDPIWDTHNKQFHANSRRCIDVAARVIAYIVSHPEAAKGPFKTLLNLDELKQSTLRLRSNRSKDSLGLNPLLWD